MKLAKSHVRHDIRKHFFIQRIVNLWNSLPTQVVHASSVNDFKNKLDAHWSNQEMGYNYQINTKTLQFNKYCKGLPVKASKQQ